MGRKRKFDFSNVESYTRCAEGQHTAKIVEIQENTTQAGDDMLTMTFEVIRGDSKGARVYDNFVLTDKALWKLKQLLQVIGVKCDGKIALDLDKLIGKVCDIAVYHEEYNGKTKAHIDEYIALKHEADDDEDELDDDEEVEEEPIKKKAPAKKAAKKQPEPEEEPEDEDWDDEDGDDEEEQEEKPKKKPAAKKATKKKDAPAKKSKKDPEPEDDEDWDDDDEDWDE